MFNLINLISISINVIQMKMICFEEFIKFFIKIFFWANKKRDKIFDMWYFAGIWRHFFFAHIH